jgi:hypothetical protein
VDAHYLEVGAAIGFAAAAGDAATAVDVGLDGAAVTGLEAVGFGAGIDNLDAKFVAEDARVVEEGLFTGESVEVGTANADTVDADEGFAGGERRFRGVVGGGELAGFFEGNLEHGGEGEKGERTENLIWNSGRLEKGRSEIGALLVKVFPRVLEFQISKGSEF